jgi:hypothetical protein
MQPDPLVGLSWKFANSSEYRLIETANRSVLQTVPHPLRRIGPSDIRAPRLDGRSTFNTGHIG